MLIRSSLMSGISPLVLFNKPGEGDPPAGGTGTPAAGQSDPPADGGAGDPPAGEGDGDAGGDDGADGAGAADGGTGGDGAGDAAPPAAAAAPVKDWRDREIARKHRQLQDERQEKERLTRDLEDAKALLARQGDPPAGDGTPPVRAPAGGGATDPDAVQRAARQMVAQQTYNDQCNTLYANGAKEYKDKWDGVLEQLTMLGGLGKDQEGVELMTSVLATDNPAQVLFKLGSNPDEYHRVMALSPARRMAEVVKLGMAAAPKPAPKPAAGDPPVEPLGRRARTSDPDPQDTDDDATWYAKRARQKQARWEAKKAGQRPSV